jgi:GNAT superfamily N-acetyltransferase
MIGTVSAIPDAPLARSIRAALAPCDDGSAAYLDLGARLDRASAVQAGRGAVAWWSLHATWDRPWVLAMGCDGREVARCVTGLVDRLGLPEGLTVARAAFPHLPVGLRPVEHWEWDWWITTDAPPPRPGEGRVVDLAADDPRIAALLAEASPDAMVRPGDPRILGWAGIEAGAVRGAALDGADPSRSGDELVAVAALTTMRPGVPHLGSVATLPSWRGLGLARDLCGFMTRRALSGGAPAVTLGMHAANRTARGVYESLGFRLGYRWASGRVDPIPVHA